MCGKTLSAGMDADRRASTPLYTNAYQKKWPLWMAQSPLKPYGASSLKGVNSYGTL